MAAYFYFISQPEAGFLQLLCNISFRHGGVSFRDHSPLARSGQEVLIFTVVNMYRVIPLNSGVDDCCGVGLLQSRS